MTKAMNKALELHQPPEGWEPNRGFQKDAATPETQRQLDIRTSLLCDDWPFMVKCFRQLMQLELPKQPTPLTAVAKQLHTTMLLSELSEFASADGVVDAADGLLDLIYVALGGLAHLGLSSQQIIAGMSEVHQSNMTKVQDNGRPLINDGRMSPADPIGKVLKTANYTKPDLAAAMSIKEDF